MKWTRKLFYYLVILLISACTAQKPASKPDSAPGQSPSDRVESKNRYTLVLTRGKVEILTYGGIKTFTKAGKTIYFYDEDRVSTGKATKALITMNESGDIVEMYSRTSLKVKKPVKTEDRVLLEKGKARFQTQKRTSPLRQFRIETANALIGVKGTEFIVDFSKNSTNLLTLEGKVGLASSGQPEVEVEVSANQVSRVQAAKLPAKPTKIPKDKIRQILNSDQPDSFGGVKFGAPVSAKTKSISKNIKVKPGSLYNQIFWEQLDSVYNYNLHWTLNKKAPIQKWQLIKGVFPGYQHENLKAGNKYYYTISYKDNSGKRTYLNLESGVPLPMPPTSPVLSAESGDRQVLLSWKAVAKADLYEVHWCSLTDDCKNKKIIKTKETRYLHQNLVNAVTYRYQVSAINAGGAGKLSKPVEGHPQMSPPAAPRVKIQPGNKSVGLTWEKVATASAYDIYWTTNRNELDSAQKKASTSDNFIILEGLENGETYYFRVKARNEGGASDFSNTLEATPRIWLKLMRSLKEMLQSE